MNLPHLIGGVSSRRGAAVQPALSLYLATLYVCCIENIAIIAYSMVEWSVTHGKGFYKHFD